MALHSLSPAIAARRTASLRSIQLLIPEQIFEDAAQSALIFATFTPDHNHPPALARRRSIIIIAVAIDNHPIAAGSLRAAFNTNAAPLDTICASSLLVVTAVAIAGRQRESVVGFICPRFGPRFLGLALRL